MANSGSRGLILATALYLANTSIGAAIAIGDNLPARFAGILNGTDIVRDFLALNGTALSPSLPQMLVLAGLAVLATRRGTPGIIGVAGLTLLGAVSAIGMLGEPIVGQVFSPSGFDSLKAVIILGNVLFPLLIVVFGVVEWARRQGKP